MRILGVIAGLMLVSSGASADLAIQAKCKGNGYKFPETVWDSGHSTQAQAQQQASVLKTFNQPTTSETMNPVKQCCSSTARPDPAVSQCPKPGSIAQQPMDPAARNLCNHPNVSWMVSYHWVCEAGRTRSAPLRQNLR
jgi:hypothetical protein